MKTHCQRSIFSYVLIPVVAAVILFGIFSIVWLRSNVRAVEYGISSLENKRMEIIKERKLLLAERSSIQSIQNVKNKGDGKLGLVFPDRVKVVYVKKGEGSGPLRASLEGRNLSGP